MGHRFRPPCPHPLVQQTLYALHPWVIAARDRVTGISIDGVSRERWGALHERPVLLLTNHPSKSEPPVMVGLARLLGEQFYYVATHELFAGHVLVGR